MNPLVEVYPLCTVEKTQFGVGSSQLELQFRRGIVAATVVQKQGLHTAILVWLIRTWIGKPCRKYNFIVPAFGTRTRACSKDGVGQIVHWVAAILVGENHHWCRNSC